MFHTRTIRLDSTRNSPVPRPSTPTRLPVRADFPLAVHTFARQKLSTLGIGANPIGSAVECCGFGVGGEDFQPENRSYPSGQEDSHGDDGEVEGLLCCPG